jgi:hypothetical protein
VDDRVTTPDVDDTSRYPLDAHCEHCCIERSDLAVVASELASVTAWPA